MFETFFALIIGHAIADFWAQSDSIAKMKNRNRDSSQFCPPGQTPQTVWPYALGAHSLIHGGMVWLITGSALLALVETVTHFAIDFGKCENWYGIHEDQAMHIGLKLIYSIIL